MSLGHVANVASGQTIFDEPSKFVHKSMRTDIEKFEKGSNVKEWLGEDSPLLHRRTILVILVNEYRTSIILFE